MGYGSTYKFIDYMQIFQKHGISAGSKIMTLGDQTVALRDKEAVKYIQQFIDTYAKCDPAKYEKLIGQRIHVSRVYADAGFTFTSIDLNEVDHSIPVDLNFWPNDRVPAFQYDVVTNEGTTEHVTNQMNAFAIIHYLARKGAVMIHEIPIVQYGAHAMVAVTPLFLKKLIDGNNYEIVQAKLKSHDLAEAKAFHHDESLEFIEGFTDLMERSSIAAMVYLVLKKTSDNAFVPPLDIALDSKESLAAADDYIDRYRGPASASQVEAAKRQLRSSGPTVTNAIVAKIDGKIKTFDRVRRAALMSTKVSPSQPGPGGTQPAQVVVTNVLPSSLSGEISVNHRFPFSLRKAFLALGLLIGGSALGVAVLVIIALVIMR
ncbi:MAG: hypothetical protein Q7V40_02720 [Pseudolabrys sp.]|nr:hypothetical protein [Pseudolabrys sp.]